MGRNNRQRRAAKAKARHDRRQGATSRESRDPGPAPGPDQRRTLREEASQLLYLAVSAQGAHPATQARAHARLAQFAAASPAAGQALGRQLSGLLTEQLRQSWRRGWQPADLHRVATRDLATGRRGLEVAVLTDAMAAELAGYAAGTVEPRWHAQLADVQAEVWWPASSGHLAERAFTDGWEEVCRAALRVQGLLAWLPDIGVLGALPGQADPAARAAKERAGEIDERVLARVRALLAKAESTPYEAEAETFTAGAQSLMARHSIDVAMLDATARDERARGGAGAIRLGVDRPYENAKALLLDRVADANRCRTVWSKELGFATVLGFPPDLQAVETLFTSLLVQATAAMRREGSRTTAWGQSRTRSFRQSFLTAFAGRIGERLAQVTREAEHAASEPRTAITGEQRAPAGARPDLLPVLVARAKEVDEATSRMFPHLVERRAGRVSDVEGWHRGRAAADQANLGSRHTLPVGH